jgi:Flp pilus assembly protein TadG
MSVAAHMQAGAVMRAPERATRQAAPTARGRDARGQASVELVLVLPLVLLVLLALLQAGLLLRDQLLVVQAAREGAREAAVSPRKERIEAAVRRAAPGLDEGLEVQIRRGPRTGDLATVAVSASPTRVPTIGRLLEGHRLEASATMRIERSGP